MSRDDARHRHARRHPFWQQLPRGENGRRRHQCRAAFHVRDFERERLWHRPRGLVVELEISLPWWHPQHLADDQLRAVHGPQRRACPARLRLDRTERDRQLPSPRRLAARAFHEWRIELPRDRALGADHHRVHHLHHLDVRRNEPTSIRSARVRNRTRRRLPHRIFVDEICPLFPRRIHRHDRGQRADCRALPRRLAFAFHPRRRGSGRTYFSSRDPELDLGPRKYHRLLRQGRRAAPRLHLGSLDAPAFPLRPAHETRLALPF